MFFNSWDALYRVAVVGVLAYVGLVLLLRVSGKRTLSKMNSFDFVVTVAMGSTLANVLLSPDVALAEGLLALALLITLQLAITWTSVRWPRFQALVKAQPRLLTHRGEVLEKALRQERVTLEEVRAAVREHGLPGIEAAEAVILETDGMMSVLPVREDADHPALSPVEGDRVS